MNFRFLWQEVTGIFETFGVLQRARISEASSSTSVEASFGDNVVGDCSGSYTYLVSMTTVILAVM